MIKERFKDLLNIELQQRDIRAIDTVLFYDLELTNKTSIRGVLNGDYPVAITNFVG